MIVKAFRKKKKKKTFWRNFSKNVVLLSKSLWHIGHASVIFWIFAPWSKKPVVGSSSRWKAGNSKTPKKTSFLGSQSKVNEAIKCNDLIIKYILPLGPSAVVLKLKSSKSLLPSKVSLKVKYRSPHMTFVTCELSLLLSNRVLRCDFPFDTSEPDNLWRRQGALYRRSFRLDWNRATIFRATQIYSGRWLLL